jgi:hypothetical protein
MASKLRKCQFCHPASLLLLFKMSAKEAKRARVEVAESKTKREGLRQLHQWLHNVGYSSSVVAVTFDSVAGAGCRVKHGKSLAANEVAFTAPKSACLTWRNSLAKDHISKIVDIPQKRRFGESQCRLAVTFVYERNLREQSFWHLYLSTVCPAAEHGVPFTWPDHELQLLRGTELEAKVAEQRKRLDAEWRQYIRPLTAADPTKFPAEVYSFDAYRDACSVVISRSSPIDTKDQGAGMIPFLSEFNHRRAGDVHLADADDTDFLLIQSQRHCGNGREIYYSYGDLGAAELLCRYGFVDGPDCSRMDYVRIGPEHLRSACTCSDEARDLGIGAIEAAGLLDEEGRIELLLCEFKLEEKEGAVAGGGRGVSGSEGGEGGEGGGCEGGADTGSAEGKSKGGEGKYGQDEEDEGDLSAPAELLLSAAIMSLDEAQIKSLDAGLKHTEGLISSMESVSFSFDKATDALVRTIALLMHIIRGAQGDVNAGSWSGDGSGSSSFSTFRSGVCQPCGISDPPYEAVVTDFVKACGVETMEMEEESEDEDEDEDEDKDEDEDEDENEERGVAVTAGMLLATTGAVDCSDSWLTTKAMLGCLGRTLKARAAAYPTAAGAGSAKSQNVAAALTLRSREQAVLNRGHAWIALQHQ